MPGTPSSRKESNATIATHGCPNMYTPECAIDMLARTATTCAATEAIRMHTTACRAVVVAVSLAIAGCATRQPVSDDLVGLYKEQVVPAEGRVTSADTLAPLSRLYRQHFIEPLKRLDALRDEEVEAGYWTAYSVAFYSHYYDPQSHEALLLDAGHYFDELSRRGKASDRDARFLHHLYVTVRQFDRAESIRLRHPDAGIAPLPAIHTDAAFDPDRPAVYTLNDKGDGLRLQNVDHDLHRTIVIVAGCPISRRAAEAIHADPVLRQAFADGNAVWLGSADALRPDEMRQWHADLPHSPLQVVHDQRPWHGDIDFTAHPNFHFFLDGKRVGFHSGW